MDEVLLNKINIIENCLKRIKEEYDGFENELEKNFTKQDSIILNLQRAAEASIDIGARIIRLKQLGFPQSAREIFTTLEEKKFLPKDLSKKMQAMVGFRNIAVHDYKTLNLEIVKSILNKNLQDFLDFTKLIFEKFK